MKKYCSLLFCFIMLLGCEDVIDVELDTAAPRLVIDASINWFKGTAGNTQTIKLSTTTSFFNEAVPPASGATVIVTDEAGNEFTFIEDGTTGNYENDTFIPVIDRNYTLTVTYEGEVYTASETLKSVAPIAFVEQDKEGGFTGEETEIKAYYTDPADEENYYFFKFESVYAREQDVFEDKFFNGNQIFSLYIEEELDTGDEVIIQSFGVSRQFYNYMFTLLSQSTPDGGAFETQPATVRGNITNQTRPDNFAYGYFRLSEADEFIYTVE